MQHRIYKFAEFELTLPDGELRTGNSTVRLQEKPLLLLSELLDHSQRVVTRQQLRERMWDSRTVVDFEQGINVAMKKVRDALGDSSEAPKYIETVAKKGYRFLVPVTVVSPDVDVPAITEVAPVVANPTIPQPIASAKQAALRWLFLAVAAAILLALGLTFSEVRKRPRDAVQIPSLAVLPFLDLSAEGNQGYFSDGMTEEILNVLAHVQGLRVASRTSSFQFRKSDIGAPAIAQKLGVRHILQGSVRKAGDTVRITAQLIDASTDQHEWSETFDRPLTTANLFAIQDDIAKSIVAHLTAKMASGADEGARPLTRTADTANLDAYDLYLKGHALFVARTQENLREARAVLQEAVARDPKFARAWESLAGVLVVLNSWNLADSTSVQAAEDAADTALRLDPGLSLAYAVRGSAMSAKTPSLGLAGWEDAMANYSHAIQNDEKDSTALVWRGEDYATLGYFDKAMQDYQRCEEVDAAYPQCVRHLAFIYLFLGRRDDALRLYEGMLARDGFIGGRTALFAPAAAARGDRLGALTMLAQEFRYDPPLINPLFRSLTDPSFNEHDRQDAIALVNRSTNLPMSIPDALWILGKYDNIPAINSDPPIWWAPGNATWLKSESRKQMMRYWHLPEYWRKHGFPSQCRPIGESDFECH
jgi:adenylate cyclase